MRTVALILVFHLVASLSLLGCSDASDKAQNLDELTSTCGTPTIPVEQALLETEVNGVARRFRLFVPETKAGVTMPILFAFQGGDGGDWPFPQEELFEALSREQKVILVRPIAAIQPGNEGAWQLNTTDDTLQDIAFINALIDKISARYCVDPKRIYATGYSLGSMFSYEVACQMSERFAAIASFAGTMPKSPAACEPKVAVPLLHIHGEDDPIIAYANEWDWKAWDSVGTMRDIPSLIAFWRERHGCKASNETQTGTAKHIVHSDCQGGARVEHYGLSGQDHGWPSAIAGTSTHRVIWDFLRGFSKP